MYKLAPNGKSSLKQWLEDLKEFQLDSMFDTNVLGRAFLYTKSLVPLKSGENILEFQVNGSATYQTKIFSSDGSIYGSCTCPYDGTCKHIAACILVSIKS